MGRILVILASGLILGPISAGVAQAQIDDHLKCYKIKDDIKLKGVVDLDGQQFGLEPGCKISKAKLFCVPVTKSNVQVEAKNDDGPVTPLPILGPPAPGDRICYKVKCPGPQPPDTTASDQFGTHNMTKFKAFMLCTPAGKFTPPPIPCDLSGYPSCGGDCPDPTQTCESAADGMPRCECAEEDSNPCRILFFENTCGGDCAVTTDVCQFDSFTGDCDCGPAPQACTDTVFPNCAGPCPSGEVCQMMAGSDECRCQAGECAQCGDGVCEGDETECNCADCTSVCGFCTFGIPFCGDGICEICNQPGESNESCPLDCPCL